MSQDYLLELNELREFLAWFLRKDLLEELVALQEMLNSSFVRKYKELCENSEFKGDCGVAKQAKELFLKMQEKPITNKIKHIYEDYIEQLDSQ